MKNLTFFISLVFATLSFSQTEVKVATFDSGFGGYFTAKEIEKKAYELQKSHAATFIIGHYGDTANSPYGEKKPEEIARYSAQGVLKAFEDGAEFVFIACNTASTQFRAIKDILNKKRPGQGEKIVSIIESSVQELKRRIDERLKTKKVVQVAILATPATIRAGAYIKALAQSYRLKVKPSPVTPYSQKRWYQVKGPTIESAAASATFELDQGKKIIVHQIGPANWVEMIERGATLQEKKKAISQDLVLLAEKTKWDVVGEFCTHFPAVDEIIKSEAKALGLSDEKTSYIKQGPLMADLFQKMMLPRIRPMPKPTPSEKPVAKIYLSGTNIQETKDLAQDLFPGDPKPPVEQVSFSTK